MPTPSTSKKSQMEASSSKKADATPLRISSRVRKEKFNVKELFGGSKDRDVSSDEEPAKSTPKKKPAVGAASKTDLGSSKPSTSKAGVKSAAEPLKPSAGKVTPLSRNVVASKSTTHGRPSIQGSKEPVASRAPVPGSSKTVGAKASILQPSKASSSVLHKTSLLKKQDSLGSANAKAGFKDDGNKPVPSPKSKVNIVWEKSDPTKSDDIEAEPLFNDDNIESVLENPGSLGLDIVVTKLTESDMREDPDSKRSKNVVTIAKLTGSSASGKPVKVVPMKPSDKISEFEDSKGPSVTIPKGDKSSRIPSVLDKKRVQVRSSSTPKIPTPAQIKEVRVNKALGNDAAAVARSIDKGVGSPFSEKKHNRFPDTKKSKQSVDTESERCRDRVESSVDKTRGKDIQRQRAIKRSAPAVASRIESDTLDVRSAEADSSSTDVEIKKAKFIRDIFGESEESVEDPKPSYDFDRYFETSQSIIEHNESLESDGSCDDTENYLSHFYEKEPPDGSRKRASHRSSDDYTIYDLMYEISCEHPSWNLHVLQDTSTFLICQVARGRHSLPVIDRMIELESDLSSAKVYVNQALHSGFKGPFDSYASIRELIANVQQL